MSDAGTPPVFPPGPDVVLEAAPRYLLGFPLFVSVTYENRSTTTFMRLPDLVPWAVVDPRVGFRLVPAGAGPPTVGGTSMPIHVTGVTLAPGERRSMLLDLSNHDLAADPGVHRLSLLVRRPSGELESAAVTVELEAPSASDAREAARLRGLAPGPDRGHWWSFLTLYRGTPVASPALSAEAAGQLALLLFYHRAILGPEPPARLDVAWLGAVTGPQLTAEVLALRLELAAARHDPEAPRLRESLLARWPGMLHRVRDLEAGEGFIAQARRVFGAESRLADRTPRAPYT